MYIKRGYYIWWYKAEKLSSFNETNEWHRRNDGDWVVSWVILGDLASIKIISMSINHFLSGSQQSIKPYRKFRFPNLAKFVILIEHKTCRDGKNSQ